MDKQIPKQMTLSSNQALLSGSEWRPKTHYDF